MADYTATARFPFRPLSYEYRAQAVAKELIIDYTAGKGDLYVCDTAGTLLKVSDIIVSRSLTNVKDNIKVTIDGTEYKIEPGLAKLAEKIKNNDNKLASVNKIFTLPVDSSGVPTGAKPTSFAAKAIPSSAINFATTGTAYLPGPMVTGDLTEATIGVGNITDLARVGITGSYNDLSNKPTIPIAGNTTTAVAAADSATQGTATTWARSDHNHYLPTSGVTAGEKGPTAAVTGTEGTTVNIPYIKVDKYGRVTKLDHYTYTSKNTTYSNATADTAGLVKVGTTLAISSGVLDQKSGIITAGSQGPTETAATTLTHGGKFKVPKITYDTYGRITASSSIEYTLPAVGADVKVTQDKKTDNKEYPLIGAPTGQTGSSVTTTTVYNPDITFNTSTKKLTLSGTSGAGFIANNTADGLVHKTSFIVGESSGNGGVYDSTHSKWVIYSKPEKNANNGLDIVVGTNKNDNVTINGDITLGTATDDTVTVKGSLSVNSISIGGGGLSGNGSALTDLNASNISSGTLNADRLPTNLGSTTIDTLTITSKIVPDTDNTDTLGSSTKKWANVYATKFTGDLTGTASGNMGLPYVYSTSDNTATVVHYITTDITVADSATTMIHGSIDGTMGLSGSAGTMSRFQAYWKKAGTSTSATLDKCFYYDLTSSLTDFTVYIGSDNIVYLSFKSAKTYSYLRFFVYKGTEKGTVTHVTAASITQPSALSSPRFTKVADVISTNASYSAGTGISLSNNTFSLATSGATAGNYGPSTNATPDYGATFNVPYISVDTYGRVTSISTKTVKIPESDNSVTANLISSTSTNYYLLAKAGTTTSNGEGYFNTTTYVKGDTLYAKAINVDSKVTINGSTGGITGNGFTLSVLGGDTSLITNLTTTTLKASTLEAADANGLKINGVTVPSTPAFTDTKVNYKLDTTTKAYIMACTSTPTSTETARTAIGDTGVYLGTSAGTLVTTGKITSVGLDAGSGAISTTGAVTAKSLTIKNGDVTYASISATGTIKGRSLQLNYTDDNNETAYGSISNIQNITTKGNATIGGNLTVTGTTTLNGTISLGSSASISGVLKYFTASIPIGTNSSWTGTSAPYSIEVSVIGILAADHPVVDIKPSGTYSTDKTMEANWSQIYRGVTAADKITFYAHSKPSAAIPIQISVIR